jgi:hypothetical protein
MGKAMYSLAEMPAVVSKLRNEADRYDLQPHHLAAELLDDCRKRNDIEGMKFWRAVWIQIMSDEYLKTQPNPDKPRRHPQLPGEGDGTTTRNKHS